MKSIPRVFVLIFVVATPAGVANDSRQDDRPRPFFAAVFAGC